MNKGGVKVIKKGDTPQPERSRDDYIRGHELSLLHLLARKYPEELQKIVEKCGMKFSIDHHN